MYWNYAIKCIIRNVIFKLMKPRNLIIIGVSLVVIFVLSSYTTVFGYDGNNVYTDKNYVILENYESICRDFVSRLSHSSSSTDYLKSFLNNPNYSLYVYYGNSDGYSMISNQQFNTQTLNIAVFEVPSRNLTGTAYDQYQGMTTSIYKVEPLWYFCSFNGNSFSTGNDPNYVYVPGCLIGYASSAIYEFNNNFSQNQTDSIIGAINNQTNSINQQTNTIQQQTTAIEEQTEAINSTDFDEDSVNIDSSSADVDNSSESGLFTTIFTSFNNSIQSDSVENISIPFPNNSGSLNIPSNIVSSHLGGLSLLVNAFWLYVFGFYAFKFVNNLLIKIKDGTILDGYTSSEVITSDMM